MTLIELLVGMTLGLIVMALVVSFYFSALSTSGDTLKASRLNQEMSAILNIMANDIRRAGYANVDGADWDGGGASDFPNLMEPSTNPFNQVNTVDNTQTTALRGHQLVNGAWFDKTDVDTTAGKVSQCYDPNTGEGVCGCIVYGYDRTDNGGTQPDNDEAFGFRYDAATNSISMRLFHDRADGDDPNLCDGADSGTWRVMNDESNIRVTKLTFDLQASKCVNADEPDGNGNDDTAEIDCYTTAPLAGQRTVERRDVLITLEAELVDDPAVKAQMSQQVSVRNDLVRER